MHVIMKYINYDFPVDELMLIIICYKLMGSHKKYFTVKQKDSNLLGNAVNSGKNSSTGNSSNLCLFSF